MRWKMSEFGSGIRTGDARFIAAGQADRCTVLEGSRRAIIVEIR